MAFPYQHSKTLTSRPRNVRFRLRDGTALVGDIYLGDGQSISPFLSSRKGGWLNVINAIWVFEGVLHPHAVLQLDDVVWAATDVSEVRISQQNGQGELQAVDILLDDRTHVRGSLMVGAQQRLSDYLSAVGRFIPIMNCTLPGTAERDEEHLGDIALNGDLVKAVRHAHAMTLDADASLAMQHEWLAKRRKSEPMGFPVVPPPEEVPTSVVPAPAVDADFTPAEIARGERLMRHWLVKVVTDAKLDPPDSRKLSDAASLEEIWIALADRNRCAQSDIAQLVAKHYRLEVSDLDAIAPEAIAAVPARVARKLGVVPVRIDAKTLTVASSEPHSIDAEQQIGFISRLGLKFEVAAPEDIRGALTWYYGAPARETGAMATVAG